MNRIKILVIILIVLVLGLVLTLVFDNNDFRKPSFESSSKQLTDSSNYDSRLVSVRDDYRFFIEGNPKYENKKLFINFYSACDDNIYLKVRVYDGDNMIGESGLIKSGEILESIKVNIDKTDNLSYLIMAYESGTYYSAGELKLRFRIGDNNEE